MRFLVIGRDGDDAEAPGRRQAARPAHLAALVQRVAAGEILHAAALLNEAGGMKGSMLICDFDSREALDAYLASEPYRAADVWRSIEIETLRPLDLKTMAESSRPTA